MRPTDDERVDRWWLAPTTLGLVGLPALWGAGMKFQSPHVETDIDARARVALAGQYPDLEVDVDGRDVSVWGRLATDADGRQVGSLVSSLRGVNDVTVRYWTPPPAVGHTVEITALPGGFTVASGALPTNEARNLVADAARIRSTATIDSGLTVSTSVGAVDPLALDGFANLVRALPRSAVSPVTVRWDTGGVHLMGTVPNLVQHTALVAAAEAIGLPVTDDLVVRRADPATPSMPSPPAVAPVAPVAPAAPVAPVAPAAPVEVVIGADGRTKVRGAVADEASRSTVVFFVATMVDPSMVDDELQVDPSAPVVGVDEAIELARTQGPPVPSVEAYAATVASLATVAFDTGSTDLDDDQLGQILDVAQRIRVAPTGVRIVVVGHSDSVGGEDFNVLISQQRAEAVRVALVFAGVPESLLSGRAAGSSQPLVQEQTWADRQTNRRVSFEVVPAT